MCCSELEAPDSEVRLPSSLRGGPTLSARIAVLLACVCVCVCVCVRSSHPTLRSACLSACRRVRVTGQLSGVARRSPCHRACGGGYLCQRASLSRCPCVCVCACVCACVCNMHANERGAQTNLPEPVRSAAVQMSYFWDRQKEKVAMQCGPLTHFIPKPAMDVWERAKDRFGDIVAQGPCACTCIIQTCWIPLPMHLRPTCMHARARARALTHTHARTPTDGVHPNEHGYRVFSDFLGQEIAELLRAQVCLRPFQHLYYCN